ncbi:hypothetical protein ACFY12_20970 [Streptomyces sp. NPDC001339]|uniref:hypothetical protein n=1 Tax=Streptomyces sp. NPDC001339 TaxID=3364563 RepID=UPI0036ADAB95
MHLGDSLAQEALTTGSKTSVAIGPCGVIRLAITLPDGAVQHFECPPAGTIADWRATDLEAPGSGFTFNEPITETWGHALTLATRNSLT